MYQRINECSLAGRAASPAWFGELPMERELGKFGKTKAQIMGTKSFQNRWAIQALNGETRYKMVRKLTGAWKKRLKKSAAARKSPEVRDLLDRVSQGQVVTEDEAVFVHAFYKRRQRNAEIEARKKRRTATGAALVAGAAVGAYFVVPSLIGAGATPLAKKGVADKLKATGVKPVGEQASQAAQIDALRAGAGPAEQAAVAQQSAQQTESQMATASAAGIIAPAYAAKQAKPTWWQTLIGARPAIQAVQAAANKIPGVGVQKPGVKPTTVPPQPRAGIPKVVLYGVPAIVLLGGAYFILKK